MEDGGKLSAEVTTNFGHIVFGERVAHPEREEEHHWYEYEHAKSLGRKSAKTGKILPAEVGWFGNGEEGYFSVDEQVLIEALGLPPTT